MSNKSIEINLFDEWVEIKVDVSISRWMSVTFNDKEMDIYENCHNNISVYVILMIDITRIYLSVDVYVNNALVLFSCIDREENRRSYTQDIDDIFKDH